MTAPALRLVLCSEAVMLAEKLIEGGYDLTPELLREALAKRGEALRNETLHRHVCDTAEGGESVDLWEPLHGSGEAFLLRESHNLFSELANGSAADIATALAERLENMGIPVDSVPLRVPFDTVVLTVRGILRIKGSLLEAMKVEPGLSADQLASMARMFLTLPESLPLEIEYTELARTVLSEGHGS